MKRTEIKITIVLLLIVILNWPGLSRAVDDFTSANFTVKSPVIDTGSQTSTSGSFGLGQSLSQTAIGKSTSGSFQLWSGFQYFFKAKANTLTATPGNTQVGLSWTVPQTFLGISVSSYEVGVGTVSGSYVFTDVGNVTSYTKTGLTNGVPYFFKIKAKTAGGLILVYSNEATATPISVTPPPPPPGPPGPPPGPPPPPPPGHASIVFKGLAYPGTPVTLLRDGQITAQTPADPGAAFQIALNNIAAGSYTFSLYTTDNNGNRSPSMSFFEMLTDNVTTTVDNIFLGPSIGTDHSIVKKGDPITIFGFTAPNSAVTLQINSINEFVENITSAANGAYTDAFNTAVLEYGGHSSKSQSKKGNLVSAASNTAEFQVGTSTVDTKPNGNCRRSDLNCDGRVNLTDFSILLYFWNQANPTNAKADINGSGVVDLTDFSILLYDWTG